MADAEPPINWLPLISPTPRHQASHHVVDAAFTPEECRRIVALAEPECAEVGSIEGDDEVDRVRSSSVSWLAADDDTWWIFERLARLVREANEGWGFDLGG